VIIEACITPNIQSSDDKRKSKGLINSSQKMIVMLEQCHYEQVQDERTLQHQIENSDQIY
jgi:hypothetical protein